MINIKNLTEVKENNIETKIRNIVTMIISTNKLRMILRRTINKMKRLIMKEEKKEQKKRKKIIRKKEMKTFDIFIKEISA